MQYVITIMQHYKIGIPGLQSLNHPAMKINLKQDGISQECLCLFG